MGISRNQFIAGSAGAVALRYPAGAAEFQYKFAAAEGDTHPAVVRSIEAVAQIARDSGGRLEIGVFPHGQLGSVGALVEQVRVGAVEFYVSGDVVIENVSSVVGLSSIPFAFASSAEGRKAMDGPFGQFILDAINKLGVYTFPKIYDHGFRQTMNSVRRVRTPAELKGLKMGLAPSYIFTSMYKALGTLPSVVDLNQTYIGLQTRIIDGSSVPLQTFSDVKLYEVEKFVSLTNHIWTASHLLANMDAWRRLPKNLQDICNHRFYDAALKSGDDVVRNDVALHGQLTQKGVTIDQIDRAAFKSTLSTSGVLREWRDHYGVEGWAVLERAIGPYRSA